MRVAVTRSESFNHHGSYTPDKAHDGDYNTFYSPKDGAMAGNFLKLYFSQAYSVRKVIIISREGHSFSRKMNNTEVKVFSTVNGENKMKSCGKITGAAVIHNNW